MTMPLDGSFVLLDAALSAREALERMELRPEARWVVVRRTEGPHVYWYSFRFEYAQDLLRRIAPETSARRALDLHEGGSSPVRRLDEPGVHFEPEAVVLRDSTRVAGVAVPPDVPRMDTPRAEPTAAAEPADILFDLPAPSAAPPSMGMGGGSGRRGGRRRAASGPQPVAPPPAAAPSPTAVAPFEAWPDLQAPPAIEEGQQFVLEIGFSKQQVSGVMGGPIVVVDAPEEFELSVQIIAVGFDVPAGARHKLRVRRDDPRRHRLSVPMRAVDLVAGVVDDVLQRVLSVSFSYRGAPCGMAMRNILVTRRGYVLHPSERDAATSFTQLPPRGVPVWVGKGIKPPDLTVTISRYDGNAARTNLAWSFESPHDISLPDPVAMPFGLDAASYTRSKTDDIVKLGKARSPMLEGHVEGAGRDIADHVPRELWKLIEAVRKKLMPLQNAPDVFVLTEEGCIPWELAWMEAPIDSSRPNYLGAQVNMGRWILGDSLPPLPPRNEVRVKDVVVVYGDYPEGAALPEAKEEMDFLAREFDATTVTITDRNLAPVMNGDLPTAGCQVLHFACHGKGNPTTPGNTHLMMYGGVPFTDEIVRSAKLGASHEPFLFMNACEAGTAGEELGTLSGFVEASLKNRFRGFIGALWEVESATARDIAIEFYTRSLGRGETVASVMRDMRARFARSPGNDVPDDTYLSYVFYGHPGLRLSR